MMLNIITYINLKGGHRGVILERGKDASLRYVFIHPVTLDSLASNNVSMLIKETRRRYGYACIKNIDRTASRGAQR